MAEDVKVVTSRVDATVNQPWVTKLREVMEAELHARLRAGFHGTLSIEVDIRDGVIQGITEQGRTKHRP